MMACSMKRIEGPDLGTCSRVLLDGECHDVHGLHAESFHDIEETHDDHLSWCCSDLQIAPLLGRCAELMRKLQQLQK